MEGFPPLAKRKYLRAFASNAGVNRGHFLVRIMLFYCFSAIRKDATTPLLLSLIANIRQYVANDVSASDSRESSRDALLMVIKLDFYVCLH